MISPSLHPSIVPGYTRLYLWGFLLYAAIALSACVSAQAAPLPYVDLSQRDPLPSVVKGEKPPLRLAVAAIISPEGTAESYWELARYLGRSLDRPVELVQRRTYAEINQLVAEDAVDLAFVCTSAYLEGSKKGQMQLLVAPQIDGQTVYYSDLIVPAQSPAQEMGDLHGKVFAFTDPMSFTGRVYPTYLVTQLGESPQTFFRDLFFTYSHDRAIEAVAAGVTDGAAVDSIVLAYAISRNPSLALQVRTIHRSLPFGIPPVVVSPNLNPHLQALLAQALLTMHEDEQGRTTLRLLGIDRFVSIQDSAYTEARQLVEEVNADVEGGSQ